MTRRTQPRGTREEIEAAIFENRGIADLTGLREALLNRVAQPVAWQMQNRSEHLRPFATFFQQILTPDSPNPRIRTLVEQLAKNTMASQCGAPTQDLRPAPGGLDTRFNDPSDLIPLLFEIIFQDEEAGLLEQWMQLLDAHAEGSSGATLAAMDQAARTSAPPPRKDIVLVGGGPLTSIVASVLGAFFRVTVVTMQRGLGKPWRNRKGTRANSSCSIAAFDAPPLPLLGGPTTRVTSSQQWNSLDVDLLLVRETLKVVCDNGSTVSYVAGYLLGALIATVILFHADDYLVRQWVDVSRLQRNADGSLRLTLVDIEDGVVRTLDATAVFLLTGPAPEQTRLTDAGSQRLYLAAAEQVDRAIREARNDLRLELEAQKQLAAAFPGQAAQEFRGQRLRKEVTRIAQEIQRRLPRLLTLTALEKLFEIWDELEALGAEPSAFPLADVITGEKSIGYVGDGDTARTLKEWAEGATGKGPKGAYPRGFKFVGRGPRGTLYNETANSPQEYAQINRRRYAGVFTPTTRAIPFKASRYRLTYDRTGQPRMEVTHRDAAGQRRRRVYDYVFDATGISNRRIEDELPAAFNMSDLSDPQGYAVGRIDTVSDLVILGVAAAFRGQNFAPEIQRILQALGIGENLLALWANGLLGERAAYAYAATRPITKAMPAAGGQQP